MPYHELDPLLHSQLRLAVMSILVTVKTAEFTDLKDKTGSTAGNLSVQLDKLNQAGYLTIQKSFKGKYPLTECTITSKGLEAFENYVKNLSAYINPKKEG